MTDWQSALTTASDALELAQNLHKADKQIDQAELKAKLADLASMLSALKQTLADAKLQGPGNETAERIDR